MSPAKLPVRGGPEGEDLDPWVCEQDKQAQGVPGAWPPRECTPELCPSVLGCRCLKEHRMTVGKHDGQRHGG